MAFARVRFTSLALACALAFGSSFLFGTDAPFAAAADEGKPAGTEKTKGDSKKGDQKGKADAGKADAAKSGASGDAAKSGTAGEVAKPGAGDAARPAAAGAQSSSATAGSPAVAQIGDKVVTLAEIDALAGGALLEVRQEEYKVRRDALDNLINGELAKREAAARGITIEELLKTEVADKAPAPTQKEIEQFYEENKERMQGQPLEALSARIGEFLQQRAMGGAQEKFFKDLRNKYNVKVLLDRPRILVSEDNDATRGPADAPITIVEFSDYQCPYCSHAEETVNQVLKKYGDRIRLIYRDYPLSFHENAQAAAEAAECARLQGKFWEMHKVLFENQDKLDKEGLVTLGEKVGVNKKKFKACLDSGQFASEVKQDMEEGMKYGVSGTPTFFINGIPLAGAQPLEAFEEIIDAELARNAEDQP